MRVVTRMAIGSAVLALVATACGGGGGSADEGSANAFTTNLNEPESLIPGKTNEDQGGRILKLLFTPLTGIDKQGKPTNLAARSIKSSDKVHWTIKLREGWKFSNGEPVTGQSFAGAWNATVYNQWDNAYFFTDVLGIVGAQQVGDVRP